MRDLPRIGIPARGVRGTEARPQDPETPVVAAAQAGDRVAFEARYLRHQPAACRTATFLLGSSSEAEDAVQAAFLAAWRGLGTFRLGAPFRPWLYAILRHEVASVLRERPRRARSPPCGKGRGPPASAALWPAGAWPHVPPLVPRAIPVHPRPCRELVPSPGPA